MDVGVDEAGEGGQPFALYRPGPLGFLDGPPLAEPLDQAAFGVNL